MDSGMMMVTVQLSGMRDNQDVACSFDLQFPRSIATDISADMADEKIVFPLAVAECQVCGSTDSSLKALLCGIYNIAGAEQLKNASITKISIEVPYEDRHYKNAISHILDPESYTIDPSTDKTKR